MYIYIYTYTHTSTNSNNCYYHYQAAATATGDHSAICHQLGPKDLLQQELPAIFRKEAVRFDSFRFRKLRKVIVSVRFGLAIVFIRFDAVRPVFFERVMVWSGSVRFGSASGSSRFGN